MDWDKGYSASYYMMEVNPLTWNDVEKYKITGGSVSRSLGGLRQSASINCKDYPQDKERWVRIYLDTAQSGSGAHEALFTGLATSPGRDIKGTWFTNTVTCYSVLKPADDVKLIRGYYAPAGKNCQTIITELMEPVMAPFSFAPNVPSLKRSIVAESGESNLTMLDHVLSAINWNLKIQGDGSIKIEPFSEEPVETFSTLSNDVIETEMTVTSDWYSCPNVLMAVSEGRTAIAKDTDPDSIMSIPNRGREVWKYENNVTLNQYETLQQYVERRLKEEQDYITEISYNRRYFPDIYPGDLINLHYPSLELDGNYRIDSQSIDLSYCARTSEKVSGVI